MKRRCFPTTVLLVAIACSVGPQVAAAQLLSNADNGLSERLYGRSAGLGTDQLLFFWEPELPLSSTTFGLVGFCNRIDVFGSFLGTHTATFKNVTLVGVDSENEIFLRNKKAKVRRGLTTRPAVWDITPQATSILAADSLVLVAARVKVTKRAGVGDLVTCGLAAVEIDESIVTATTEQEVLQSIGEFAMTQVFRQPSP